MKWRKQADEYGLGREHFADVGPFTFYVSEWRGCWHASYDSADGSVVIGEYRTEKAAKTFAYRRAKAMVERMVREVRDA